MIGISNTYFSFYSNSRAISSFRSIKKYFFLENKILKITSNMLKIDVEWVFSDKDTKWIEWYSIQSSITR